MGGAVKSVAKVVTGGGGSAPAPAPSAAPSAAPAKQATVAETSAAKERQAAFNARRGRGASLLSYERTLGSRSKLIGEDM
jgi:hypothetical protein